MTPAQLLSILSQAAKLKTNTRHCYTEPGRKESVADHSWRLALMAMLLRGVPEYAKLDMDRVIRMCLIHDLGESFTGDVPTFEKTDDHEKTEERAYLDWVDSFPSPVIAASTPYRDVLSSAGHCSRFLPHRVSVAPVTPASEAMSTTILAHSLQMLASSGPGMTIAPSDRLRPQKEQR